MEKLATRKRGEGLSPGFLNRTRQEIQKAKAEGKDFRTFFSEKVLELANKKTLTREEKQTTIEDLIREAQSVMTEAEAEEPYLQELAEIEEWAKQERTEEEWERLAEEAEEALKVQVRGYGG